MHGGTLGHPGLQGQPGSSPVMMECDHSAAVAATKDQRPPRCRASCFAAVYRNVLLGIINGVF